VEPALRASIVGSPERVRQELDAFVARTGADELIVVAHVYDHAARLASYEIAMDASRARLTAPRGSSALPS
jgi:alkanesulfonate monooxygenase SsuD/methylene tetrahydromethanopterin reductase-like flavin-dependent oxidoreductase (luciferase family)